MLRSTGEGFGEPELWLVGEGAEAPGWFFADVSGEGMADAIAIDVTGVRLFLSDGERFASAGPLSVQPALGERDTSVADVNGDGRADVITHHHESIVAFLSTGTGSHMPAFGTTDFTSGGSEIRRGVLEKEAP